MSDLKKIGEMAAQEIGQRAIKSVVNNPQAALATGAAVAKTAGGAIIAGATAAAPFILGAAIGVGIVWGIGKIFED